MPCARQATFGVGADQTPGEGQVALRGMAAPPDSLTVQTPLPSLATRSGPPGAGPTRRASKSLPACQAESAESAGPSRRIPHGLASFQSATLPPSPLYGGLRLAARPRPNSSPPEMSDR